MVAGAGEGVFVGTCVAVAAIVAVGGIGVQVGMGVAVDVAMGNGVFVAVGDGMSVFVGSGVMVGKEVAVAGAGVGVSNWIGVAGKVAVLIVDRVDVGMGVRIPGCRMLLGVAVGVGEITDGKVGGIRSALSSGANM